MDTRRLVLVGFVAILLVSAVLVVGCARRAEMEPGTAVVPPAPVEPPASAETIRQIGSTTVLPIAEAWQKKFSETHPSVKIAVSGGGSGAGIEALISGTCEVASSSREIKDKEREQAAAAGVSPVEHIIAHDGIAVVVHPSNPVSELSIEQLSDMFTGKIRNWKDVGGQSGEIQIISRDSASGTYEAFKELVVTLNKTDKERDYAAEALKQASNQAVLTSVAQTKAAIGYIGLGYLDETVKALRVIPMGGGTAVEVTADAVLDGTYPVSRALYMYTNGEPTGIVKEYLDWGKGPEGQAIVAGLGFVPISK